MSFQLDSIEFTFLRHAEPKRGYPDKLSPLTIEGKKQAKERAFFFSSFDTIVTSSALRAIETAQIIQTTLGLKIDPVIIDALYAPLISQMPLSSSFEEFKKECLLRGGRKILVVFHAQLINYYGLQLAPGNLFLEETFFHYCEGFTVVNGSVVNVYIE